MKRLPLVIVCIALGVAGYAQNGNNICVFNSISNYVSGGGPSELERGITCSDAAAVNESTINDKKTWYYRGQLYTLIFQDSVLKKKYGDAAFLATAAFKKLYDLNDPKFKDWDDVFKYLIPLEINMFNEGADQYHSRNFALAFKYFYSIKDLDAVIKGKNKNSTIEMATVLKNAALSAENSGDADAAVKVYKEWLDVSPNPYAYKGYADGLRKTKKPQDTVEASRVIDEGLAKFPNDQNLLIEKIDGYLQQNDYVKALGYVNSFLAIDPKNDGAMFIKGLAYEKIGNEDSVLYYYKKAAETNPKNMKPLYNLGVWYLNKGNAIVEQMNKLSNSAEDNKKYTEMKKQSTALYNQAKPYFKKAHELDPSDETINRTLKRIDALTAE